MHQKLIEKFIKMYDGLLIIIKNHKKMITKIVKAFLYVIDILQIPILEKRDDIKEAEEVLAAIFLYKSMRILIVIISITAIKNLETIN